MQSNSMLNFNSYFCANINKHIKSAPQDKNNSLRNRSNENSLVDSIKDGDSQDETLCISQVLRAMLWTLLHQIIVSYISAHLLKMCYVYISHIICFLTIKTENIHSFIRSFVVCEIILASLPIYLPFVGKSIHLLFELLTYSVVINHVRMHVTSTLFSGSRQRAMFAVILVRQLAISMISRRCLFC